jgi:hypothetical protein
MQNCNDCHFLSKEILMNNGQFSFSLSNNNREVLINDINSISNEYSLKCTKGVWDEGVEPNLKNDRNHIINKVNRENFCFHFPVHEGMLFQAASELQQREEEYKKNNRNNKYTQIGLYIAALGLIANAIISIVYK